MPAEQTIGLPFFAVCPSLVINEGRPIMERRWGSIEHGVMTKRASYVAL